MLSSSYKLSKGLLKFDASLSAQYSIQSTRRVQRPNQQLDYECNSDTSNSNSGVVACSNWQ